MASVQKKTLIFPEKARVEAELIELGLDPTNPEVIEDLTADQARTVFLKLWTGSRHIFCDYYQINQGNFAKFCKGQRGGRPNINAIQNYLRQSLFGPTQVEIVPLDRLAEHVRRLVQPNTKAILFIDQAIPEMESLREQIMAGSSNLLEKVLILWYVPSSQVQTTASQVETTASQVVPTASPVVPTTVAGQSLEEWSDYPQVIPRIALDHRMDHLPMRIAMDTVILNQQLPDYPDLEFILVSKDEAMQEIFATMDAWHRPSDWIDLNHRYFFPALDVHFSEELNLDQITEIRSGAELIGWHLGYPDFAVMIPELLQARPDLARAYYQRDDLNLDELREIFRYNWPKSVYDFARTYQLNPGLLSSFIYPQGQLPVITVAPEIEAAVRTYLATLNT